MQHNRQRDGLYVYPATSSDESPIYLDLDYREYKYLAAAPGSLDIARGVAACSECFVASIPVYRQNTGALIGLARFHSSPRFLHDLVAEVHGKLLWGSVAAFLLIALAWADANRLMRRLREAKDAADRANRAKTTFLATMSHEIRAPLNVILGMTHLLDRADMPEEQRRQLEAIRQAGDTLFAVVSDVLDFSQIESGQLRLERTELDLRNLILRTLTIFTLRAEQKGLRLEHRIDPAVDGRYFGDPNRIRQILINLLGNAVKFTSEGWVRLDVEVSATDGETRMVLFRVSDSGIGLFWEQLPHLFADFPQGDHGVSRRFAGAGLGLAICRRLAELMGGEIGAGGGPGKGGSFWVKLPLRRAEAHRAEGADAPSAETSLGSLRLLVVDDEPLNRLFLKSLLEQWGHRVHLAKNGLEALQAIDTEPFDLILLDRWMPTMHGFEAARRIRELPDPEVATIPIVALTADVTDEAATESRRSGICEVVAKPIGPDKLAGLLRTYCTGYEARQSSR